MKVDTRRAAIGARAHAQLMLSSHLEPSLLLGVRAVTLQLLKKRDNAHDYRLDGGGKVSSTHVAPSPLIPGPSPLASRPSPFTHRPSPLAPFTPHYPHYPHYPHTPHTPHTLTPSHPSHPR